MKFIPANVEARIRAGTVFGAKFVELVYPSDPSPQRLSAGAIIESDNVSTEINTVFRDVADILDQVDPAKLQAHAVGARRRTARPRRDHRPDHHRRQRGAQGSQRPRGHHQRRRAGGQADQRRVQRCRAGHPDHARRGRHQQHDRHRQRGDARRPAHRSGRPGTRRHRPVRLQPGRPDPGRATSSSRPRSCCSSTTRRSPARWSAPRPRWTPAIWTRPAARTTSRSSSTAPCCSGPTPTAIRRTCRSSAPRAAPAANPAADRCPTSPPIGLCASSSPTPVGERAWTSGPIPASASPATPTTCPSPARFPNRPASAIRAARRRDRSPTPAPRPTGPRCTPPTAPRCGPGCPPRRRRAPA